MLVLKTWEYILFYTFVALLMYKSAYGTYWLFFLLLLSLTKWKQSIYYTKDVTYLQRSFSLSCLAKGRFIATSYFDICYSL